MNASDRLAQSRKQSASWANRASDSGRSRPRKGNRTHRAADKAARREFRNLGPLRLLKLNERAVASRLAKRPAETWVQPAGVGRAPFAGIGDFDRDCERVGAQPIFERKREGERIDGARARIVAERQPREVRR